MAAHPLFPRFTPEFTYDPRPGYVFIERNARTKYVLLEIIGINYLQLLHTNDHNTSDLIYKACYYTSDWVDNDNFLPSGYATIKFIRGGPEVLRSKLAEEQPIPDPNIINVEKWAIQKYHGGYCVALPYMSEGSLRYILSTRFHNGLPEDCIAIALKQALRGLFVLHNLGLIHKCFSAGNIYVNFKSNVEIKLGFAATIYDSELESPLFVSHGTELGVDSTVTDLQDDPPGHPNLELGELYRWAAAPEVFYSPCDDAHTVHSDIWLVGVAALELAYGNLRISDHEEFEAMIKKIKRSRRLPDKLEDVLEEYHEEEKKGKTKKVMGYLKDKMQLVKCNRMNKFSKEFEELVLDCLSTKESKRPSVVDLLQRPFFRNAKNLQWFQRRVLYAKDPMPYYS